MDGFVTVVAQGLFTAPEKTVWKRLTTGRLGHLSEDNGPIILAL